MRRLLSLLRFLHAWAGVALALLLMVVSLSGTLLVWKQDYVRLVLPKARDPFIQTPEHLARLAGRIEARFEANDILSVAMPTAEFGLAKVVVYPDHYAYLDGEGDIVTEWQGNGRFEEWLFDLHHRLLMADTGLLIVGFGSMALVMMVFSGLVLWWPLRRGRRLRVWPRSATRAELNAAHRHLGLFVALPLLFMLVTGILLVFPQQSEDWLLSDIRRDEDYNLAMMSGVDGISGGDSGDWLPVFERAMAVFPDAQVRSIDVPGAFNVYRIIGFRQPGEWSPLGMSKVYVEAEGGYMDVRIDALGLPAIERAWNAVYPLHTGRTGSRLYQAGLTLVGISLFILSALGLWSFLRRWARFAR